MSFLPTEPPTLRPYQIEALQQVDAAIASGACAPLLVLPTGSGKTVIAAELICRERDAGRRVLFLAPRRELVHQTCEKLHDCGVSHGVLMAGAEHLHVRDADVQVGSIDTIIARTRSGRLCMPEFDIVIVDEAHLSVTDVRQKLMSTWPNALRLGMTATPTRKDGRALGLLYDALIEPATTAALTAQGYLCPVRYFSVSKPDLARVRTVAGDYNAGDLDAVMNQAVLVGDIVEHWLRHAGGRRTVVFCTSIDHSAAMAGEFLRAGVAAEHVDAGTPQAQRAATFQRFRSGDTQVLTNCFLASYGFDLPALSCVVMARPTKSLMLWLQMLGRGLRPAPGKSDCVLLDHSGSVHMHGFAADPREWTLDGTMALAAPAKGARGEISTPKVIECPECHACFSGTRVCPECGYYLAPRGRPAETRAGTLVEMDAGLAPEVVDQQKFHRELRAIGKERGYKDGWASNKYKDRFAKWPPWLWNTLEPLVPTMETRRWVKSRQIAWAKTKVRRTAGALPMQSRAGEVDNH